MELYLTKPNKDEFYQDLLHVNFGVGVKKPLMDLRALLAPTGGKFDLLGYINAIVFFDQMNIRICQRTDDLLDIFRGFALGVLN